MNKRFIEALRNGSVDPYWCACLHGGGKGSTPPAPDYSGAAKEQAASSKEIATQQTFANRPNINTPFGSETWSAAAGTDPSSGQGVTNWTSNISLTPDQQDSLDSQMRIQSGRSDAAEQLLGQATSATATPFSWDSMPDRANAPGVQTTNAAGLDTSAPGQTTQTTNEPAFAGERARIENSLFDRMRPEHQRQEDATRTRLANMGLGAGGEAYNRELEGLGRRQADERFNATQTAGGEQARMQQMLLGQQQQAFGQDEAAQRAQNAALQGQFGMQAQANQQNFGQGVQSAQFQNQNRQQAIAEEAQRRGMPLSELNALLTGQQVNMPQMPSFNNASAGQAANMLGAATAQGQYGLQAAEMNKGTDWGSLIGSGAMAVGTAM